MQRSVNLQLGIGQERHFSLAPYVMDYFLDYVIGGIFFVPTFTETQVRRPLKFVATVYWRVGCVDVMN